MKISNNTFHVVTIAGKRHIYDNEDNAIDHLRENTNDVDPEGDDVSVAQVSIEGEDWKITELPWQQIALRLLQED
jgi:hypothetical protein